MTIGHLPPIGLATAEQIAAMAPSGLNATGPTPSEELSREVDLLRQGATERVAALARAPGETDADFRTRMHEGLDPVFLRACGLGAPDEAPRHATIEEVERRQAHAEAQARKHGRVDGHSVQRPASDECVRMHLVEAMERWTELAGCFPRLHCGTWEIWTKDEGEYWAGEIRRDALTDLVEDCRTLAREAAAAVRALPPPPCPACSSWPLLCEYHGEANARGLAAKDESDALVAEGRTYSTAEVRAVWKTEDGVIELGGPVPGTSLADALADVSRRLAKSTGIPEHVLRGEAQGSVNNIQIDLGGAVLDHKAMRVRDARPPEMTAAEWIAWCERSDIPDRIRGTSLAASLLRGDYEQAPKGYTFGWDGDGSILVMRVAQGRSQAGNVTHYTHAEWLGASNHSAALAWARTMLRGEVPS